MNNILDLQLNELKELCGSIGEPAYRAAQIFGWLAKGVKSFDEMSNLPSTLIEKLNDKYYIGLPSIVRSQESNDGTIKCLYSFPNFIDDASGTMDAASAKAASSDAADSVTTKATTSTEVEAVFMKYSYGNSICISSQAGCRMGCSFCASTMDGLERSLTAGEMLAEVLAMRNHTGEDIRHVVVMGMGEPFDNYDEVIKFIRLIHDPKGYDLGLRNITVSTCGIVPGIREFAADMPQVNLAISLHAPNQEMRARTMPIAGKYGYDELMSACREYTDITRRRITFEYALIDGVNDSEDCANELAGRLKGMLCHVNLIPLNEVSGRDYKRSQGRKVQEFKKALEDRGIPVTVRRTLGSDIDAACGQLRHNS